MVTHTTLLFNRRCGSLLPAVVPTPAGTRAGIGQRWVTVPVTGRRHGRATEPIAIGLRLSNSGRRRFTPTVTLLISAGSQFLQIRYLDFHHPYLLIAIIPRLVFDRFWLPWVEHIQPFDAVLLEH